ncbi:MAG: hypothetical protein E7492_02540 [Ruminococcaceae bacterium]|nr:hypothetical protein [Oscillospiraceae bacterium]
MKKIIIFLTFLALLCGCSNTDINNSTNTQNTAEEIKINLTDLEENLEGKIIDFIWLNDVELLLKITKDNNEILFYSYNIEEDIFNKKLSLINENTYSLSRVVSYGDIKYISEFGGDRYRYSDNNMELLERNDYFNNPTSTYRDAVNGNIIYFDDKHSKLYFNDEYEFIIDKDCLPRLISISPDNKIMSYSLIKGISNVTSLCMYDMESQEELCFDVNLEMPYFFWKNNEPVYITIQPSENISFWDIVNSKVANIYLSSEYVGAVFQSSKYKWRRIYHIGKYYF